MKKAPEFRRSDEHRLVEQRLQELELLVGHRLHGMLQGDYQGLFAGPGSEAGDGRRYQVGDDVRRMDWKLTARMAAPHVRDTIADRELEAWVVIDESPSLRFGTRRRTKWDLALAALATVGFLTARGGNRVGVVTFGAGPAQVHPSRAGREGVYRLLHDLDRPSHRPMDTGGPTSDLPAALDLVRRLARHRGIVAVVSDFLLDDQDWEQSMRGIRARHDVLAFEVVDPLELQIPAAGMLTLVDPETGRQLELQSSRAGLRSAYAQLAAAQRAQIVDRLRRAGAEHVTLRTDSDWVVDIARFVSRRRAIAKARLSDRTAEVS
jgi:uncharacterized protein (DUF58 family)